MIYRISTIFSTMVLTTALTGALATSAMAQGNHSPIRLQPKLSGEQFQTVTHSRGSLGAQVISISEDLKRYFGAPAKQGVLVDSVLPDSPAQKGGLLSGDVILSVKGNPIYSVRDVLSAMIGLKKGDRVALEILRNKKRKILDTVLDTSTQSQMSWRSTSGALDFDSQFGKGGAFEMFGKGFPFGAERDLVNEMKEMKKRLRMLEVPKQQKNNPKKGKTKAGKKIPWTSSQTTGSAA